MKQKIIILIVVIILVIIIFNLDSKKEHYVISPTLDVDKLNETVRQYYYNRENREIENINVSKDIELLNKTLHDELIQFKYPVGSFYVQFGDTNQAYDPQSNTLFPVDKSPEKLFGGKWEEQWRNDGIFFRTGGTLSMENRQYGRQDWAVKNLYGWTSWAQAHNGAEDNKRSGVFKGWDVKTGRTDGGNGRDKGGSNVFDSSKMGSSAASSGEVRLRNRLIQVWRRIS
jgi:hypothetical protein